MLELVLCLFVWNGGGLDWDCSTTVHLLNNTEYKTMEAAFYEGSGRSIGVYFPSNGSIYLNTGLSHLRDVHGINAWYHEVLHAQLYLNWRAAGSPGPCWCYFH